MRQYLNKYLENDEKTKIKLTDLYTHYCKVVDDPLSYEKFCDFIRPIYTLKRFTDGNYIIGMKLKQIKQKSKSSDQSFILHITDTHFGKKTLSYNYNKACGYMDSLAKRLDIIAQRDDLYNKCDEFHIMATGDMVDGFGIFPSQAHYLEESDPIKQVEWGIQALQPLFEVGAKFKSFNFHLQAGNHGKVDKRAKESSNWDVLFGSLLIQKFGQRATVGYYRPRVVPVKNYGFLLNHGDDINSSMGIPFYGILRIAKEWAINIPNWQYLLMGHFHTCAFIPINHQNGINAKKVYMGGTIVSDDDFSIKRYGKDGDPSWWAFVVDPDPRVGITSEHRMNLHYE